MNTIRAYRAKPKPRNRYQVIGDETIGTNVVTVDRVADGFCSVVWTEGEQYKTAIVEIDDLLTVPSRVEYQTSRSGTGPVSVERPWPHVDRDTWSHLWVSVPIVTCGTQRQNHLSPHPLITEEANRQRAEDDRLPFLLETNPPHYCTEPITVIEHPDDAGEVPWSVVLIGALMFGLIFTAIEALPRALFLMLFGLGGVVALGVLVSGVWRRPRVRRPVRQGGPDGTVYFHPCRDCRPFTCQGHYR